MLDFFHTTNQPVHILLSKADKLSKSDQINTLSAVKKSLKPFMERQQVSIQLFSSLKKQGIEEVNTVVHEWFENQAALDQNDELADTPPIDE